MVRLAAAFVAIATLCGLISSPASAQDKNITIFAAASMKNALDEIDNSFTAKTGIKAVASYAASSVLAKQIEQGAPADIFMSADADWLNYAATTKAVNDATRINLLGNSIVLIAPAAALAKVTGTAWALGVARLLTVGADAACVALLGLLVRHRGPLAAGVAGGVYAVYPDALLASHTFLLEPWLNLCCLIGALVVFDGDQMAGNRRLVWGGAAFGFAVAVKLWAVIPLAIVALLLARWPRRMARPIA